MRVGSDIRSDLGVAAARTRESAEQSSRHELPCLEKDRSSEDRLARGFVSHTYPRSFFFSSRLSWPCFAFSGARNASVPMPRRRCPSCPRFALLPPVRSERPSRQRPGPQQSRRWPIRCPWHAFVCQQPRNICIVASTTICAAISALISTASETQRLQRACDSNAAVTAIDAAPSWLCTATYLERPACPRRSTTLSH